MNSYLYTAWPICILGCSHKICTFCPGLRDFFSNVRGNFLGMKIKLKIGQNFKFYGDVPL